MSDAEMDTHPSAKRPWFIAVVVSLATFMEVLDTTVVNVALPHIAGNLGAGQDESTWVITSYLVANAVALPLSVRFERVWGRKRFYLLSVALFTLMSTACGLASSLALLVGFRVLQGFIGGGLQPTEQAILADSFSKEHQGVAFAIAGVTLVSAPMLGPTVGGWLVDHWNWRWVFFVNVPIGCLAIALIAYFIEDAPARTQTPQSGRFDFVGIFLIALALGSLQLSLDRGEREDWFDSAFIDSLLVVSLLAASAGVWKEWRAARPVLDLRLYKSRTFAAANILIFVLYMLIFSSTLLLPLLLQTHFGYTATLAGLVLSPGALVNLFAMPLVGRLVNKVSYRLLIVTGFICSGLALAHLTTLSLQTDFGSFVWARCLITLSMALAFVPINVAAYRDIAPASHFQASTFLAISRNIGASVGIAIAITLVTHQTQFHQAVLSEHLTAFSPNFTSRLATVSAELHAVAPYVAGMTEAVFTRDIAARQGAVLAYFDAFSLFAVVSLLTVPVAFLLRKPRDQLVKH